ncbi:NUDIX hydrolase [Candidatus Woesearchaeota archaeon]|nr:NUDIX hydrolase [Candidatus Woesearchaeota archaeon]
MKRILIICTNIIEHKGRILLVKEAGGYKVGTYSLPGGKLNPHESIVQAAIREAKEETGLNIKPEKFVGIYQLPTSKKGDNLTVFVFKSRIMSGKLRTCEEHPEVRFFSYNEIKELARKKLLRTPSIMIALKDVKKGKFLELSALRRLYAE